MRCWSTRPPCSETSQVPVGSTSVPTRPCGLQMPSSRSVVPSSASRRTGIALSPRGPGVSNVMVSSRSPTIQPLPKVWSKVCSRRPSGIDQTSKTPAPFWTVVLTRCRLSEVKHPPPMVKVELSRRAWLASAVDQTEAAVVPQGDPPSVGAPRESPRRDRLVQEQRGRALGQRLDGEAAGRLVVGALEAGDREGEGGGGGLGELQPAEGEELRRLALGGLGLGAAGLGHAAAPQGPDHGEDGEQDGEARRNRDPPPPPSAAWRARPSPRRTPPRARSGRPGSARARGRYSRKAEPVHSRSSDRSRSCQVRAAWRSWSRSWAASASWVCQRTSRGQLAQQRLVDDLDAAASAARPLPRTS